MARAPNIGELRQDLTDQCERAGLVGGQYTDLIGDYLRLVTIKRSLLADIKKRGAKVETTDRFGITTVRSNESIADALKVNAQMLKILDFLGAELAGGSDSWDDEM